MQRNAAYYCGRLMTGPSLHYGLGVIPQSKVNQYLQQSRLEQWLAVGDYVRIFLAWGFDINQTQTE